MGIFRLFVENKLNITLLGNCSILWMPDNNTDRTTNTVSHARAISLEARRAGGMVRHTNSRPADSRTTPHVPGGTRIDPVWNPLRWPGCLLGRRCRDSPRGSPTPASRFGPMGWKATFGTGSGGERTPAHQQTATKSPRASTGDDSRGRYLFFRLPPRSHHAPATQAEPDNEVRHRPDRVCRPVASQEADTGRASSG